MKNSLKSIYIVVFFLFQIVFYTSVKAQLDISGFFDAAGVGNFLNSKQSEFLINQFEMDFSYAHKSHFSVGAATTYNNDTQNMQLAMAFIHYSFEDGPGKHPRREETYDHSAFLIGKFDMPFGLDYLSYASVDRPTFTQPLVIEKTIAGWNDIGMDFHLFYKKLKFDVWAVNGFSEGIGLGGNVRYSFFPFLEIGVSHSSDIANFHKINDWLSGVDLYFKTDVFKIKSEYLWMKGVYEGAPDSLLDNNTHYGGYIQVLTELEELIALPLFVTLRFGGWQCSEDDATSSFDDAQHRYTATIGYNLHKNLSIRLEVSANTYNNAPTETLGIIQIVVNY